MDKAVFYISFFIFQTSSTILMIVLRVIFFKNILKSAHSLLGIKKKILFLEGTHYGGAGYKYRAEKWMDILSQNGYSAKGKYVFKINDWNKKFKVHKPHKFLLEYMVKKFFHIISVPFYSHIIVRRELLIYNDFGNLFSEKLLRTLHYNLYLDYDDDIQATKPKYPKTLNSKILGLNSFKFYRSLNYYDNLIVGNKYLYEQSLTNSNIKQSKVEIIPTCVDYYAKGKKIYKNKKPLTFGWVGSDSNIYCLEQILGKLNLIAQNNDIELLVISKNGLKRNKNFNFKIINVPWEINKEIENILKIDIGLMPLSDASEEVGKCGFKLIQYMGLGIVSIATSVGVNSEIIQDKKNGFLVENNNWVGVINEVISRKTDYNEIGENARKSIHLKYSFQSNTQKFLRILN